jgi:hypothetical protein
MAAIWFLPYPTLTAIIDIIIDNDKTNATQPATGSINGIFFSQTHCYKAPKGVCRLQCPEA